jgi:hypothetical protein
LAARSILAIAPFASFVLIAGAQAQGSTCEQFKTALAARIDPSIRAYSLEIAPKSAPVPPGAKVIGTCEGGAKKILLRRGGQAQIEAVPAASAAAPTLTAAATSVRPEPRPSATPKVDAPSPPAERTAVSGMPQAAPPSVAASSLAMTAPATNEPEAAPSFTDQASGFVRKHWPWLAAILVVPILVWLRAWLAYRSAYDASGLPRGPKLN